MELLKLELHFDKECLKAAAGRYHYQDTDLKLLYEVYQKLAGRLAARAGYGIRGPEAYVVLTLGEGADGLIQEYMDRGLFTESYMAECLCGELMRKGYEELNEAIFQKHGLRAVRYLFPGEELPLLEWEKRIFENAGDVGVTLTESGALLPRQSVAFVAELSEDEQARFHGICADCGRKECPWRRE